MYTKILLGVDGSEESMRAVKKVASLQKKFKSQVVVFHSIEHHMLPKVIPLTVPLSNTYQYSFPVVDRKEIEKEYEKEGERVLEAAKRILDTELVPFEHRLVKDIDPEDYIIERVEKENFDLVVVGCKGKHSKVKQFILGTVATKVLNDAPCDVLIVR
ncbi:MAG: universal stress protein [Promethearchaeota archaeon]|nr:MAG: universal stress protein [Candidatus Lokiarchaeota archaeon]